MPKITRGQVIYNFIKKTVCENAFCGRVMLSTILHTITVISDECQLVGYHDTSTFSKFNVWVEYNDGSTFM